MTASQLVLDRVQSLAKIGDLITSPATYAEAVAAELGPATTLGELEARDAILAKALAQIDAMIPRAMRISLEHALVEDASIAPPTRNVFAQTVLGYASDLALLAERARDIAARGGARDPGAVAERVCEAARVVLKLRDELGVGVLALVRELATAAAPAADAHARDRRLEEPTRRRWSAVRRDLQALAASPELILSGSMAARLAELPDQLDDPDPAAEPTWADMIELD